MDVNVFVFSCVFPLILILLAFLGRKVSWGLLSFFGTVIALIATIAIFGDGNLTQTASGVTSTIAAANGNIYSDFGVIEMTPFTITLAGAIITLLRVFKLG